MNKPTVQDIFRHFYPAYLESCSPSPEQAKVARNILNCKTGAYGANVSVCEDCGAVQIHYNSCRNRCCPMCQAVPKEMWMEDVYKRQILCCMRGDLNQKENLETLELAKKYLVEDGVVVAIDLAGAEALFPTENYEALFATAREYQVPFTLSLIHI